MGESNFGAACFETRGKKKKIIYRKIITQNGLRAYFVV